MSSTTSLVMFQKSLQDLVKGIRAQKRDASSFISQAIVEIKTELKSTDPFVKAEAVRKLTYLQMNGYNVSWASFSIIEVMSQSRFAHKRIGYLAANQSFTETTDVVLLTTNLFKKEFVSSAPNSQYEVGLAINCLANIVNKDLARDCMSDLVTLMNHSRPYVRKKAVLGMYKLYVKYPAGLRVTFDKLKDRLDDPESPVTSCAVNVICELANKNPRNYLAMAPKFFRLLTTSANNWMLIKVVKLLGSLVSEEPRLARKLLDPLSTIIQSTTAKSLQFECIYTVTLALPYTKREDGTDARNVPIVVKLCSDSLRQFIEDADQNLKYLGLVGLVNLMASHPKAVVDHRELVLRCLNDDDVTIRTRALELLSGMVTKKTIVDLVTHLLQHVQRAEGNYRDEIIAKILLMGSRDKFSFISDFAWYTSVLLELASMQGAKHGREVAEQLIEITIRVDTVRPYAVEAMLSMLLNENLILGQARKTVSEVLKAAAWIVGEYSDIVTKIALDIEVDEEEGESDDEDERGYWIEGPTGEDIRSAWRHQPVHSLVIASLLHPRATNLPPHVQSCYMQAALKLFITACVDCEEEQLIEIVGSVRARLAVFLQSVDLEIQERASFIRQLLSELEILPIDWEEQAEEEKSTNTSTKEVDLLFVPLYTSSSIKAVDEKGAKAAKLKSKVLASLSAEVFYPVHSKAQRRVPVPENINLDTAFNSTALDQLLDIEDPPANLTLASLSFSSSITYDEKDHRPLDEEEARISRLVKSSFENDDDDHDVVHGYTSYSGDSGAGSVAGGFTTLSDSQSSSDKLFYLSGSGGGGGISGGNMTDAVLIPEKMGNKKGGKKGKDKKGGKKSKHKVEINKQDMLPVGAVESDEEDDGPVVMKKKKGTTNSTSKSKKMKDELDLENVDITTPLQANEILPVQTHRIVVDQPPPPTTTSDSSKKSSTSKGSKKNKSSSKNKNEKEVAFFDGEESDEHTKEEEDIMTTTTSSKSKKSHSKKGSQSVGIKKSSKSKTDVPSSSSVLVDDLLGLEWNTNPSMAASPSTHIMQESNSNSNNTSTSKTKKSKVNGNDKENDKNNEKSSTKRKSSNNGGGVSTTSKSNSSHSKVWLSLYSDRNLTIYYATQSTIESSSEHTTLLLSIRCMNNASDGSAANVELNLSSLGPLRTSKGTVLQVASSLASGSEVQSSLEFIADSIPQSTITIGGILRTSLETLLSSETNSTHVSIPIPLCVFFTPLKLTADGFAALLGKSSSKWGSSNTRIPYSSKSKTAIKAIAGFLHAHVIESEIGKAASLASKSPSGASICCLAKQGKDESIVLDIKVLGTTKGEGQIIADSLSTILTDLSL